MTQEEQVTAGHTPGPWAISNGCDRYICSAGKCVASTMGVNGEEGRANARLIAAAPELLELVGVLLGHDDRFRIMIGGNPSATDDLLARARSIYAKATGES